MSRRSRMKDRPKNPRQRMLEELQELLALAREAISTETDPLLITADQLTPVLALAERTAKIARTYTIQRELMMEIYGLLISGKFDFRLLDENFQGRRGKRPTAVFDQSIKIISTQVAGRIPVNEAHVRDPLTGESLPATEVRMGLIEFLTSIGRHVEASAFAA